MERTGKAVMIRAAVALLLAASAPGRAAAADRSDVIVVERPDRLLLYNRYQQHLTTAELSSLRPFTPFRVLKPQDLLGDGFTPCMDVEISGTPFYIVGGTSGASQAGFVRLYRDADLFDDTVEVLRSHGVVLVPPDRRSPPRVTSRGDRLVRVFRTAGETFIHTTGAGEWYGWAMLNPAREGKDWRVAPKPVEAGVSLSPPIVERIRGRLGETNALLRKLFAFFNGRTGERRVPPQWDVQSGDDGLRCSLTGGESGPFAESTAYLARDLDNLILGTGYRAVPAAGRIDIVRRP